MIPLVAKLETGCRIVYEPEAIAHEEIAPDISDEFKRRARIGAGGWQAIGRLWKLLDPRRGWVALSFFSHKVLRWLCPFFLIGLFGCLVVLSQHAFYRGAMGAEAGFLLLSVPLSAHPRKQFAGSVDQALGDVHFDECGAVRRLFQVASRATLGHVGADASLVRALRGAYVMIFSCQNSRTIERWRTFVVLLLLTVVGRVATADAPASPGTYYVSPSGSDRDAGTAAAPWKTLGRAAKWVMAGDTVIVRPGGYEGFILGWDSPQSGTAGTCPLHLKPTRGRSYIRGIRKRRMGSTLKARAISSSTASPSIMEMARLAGPAFGRRMIRM